MKVIVGRQEAENKELFLLEEPPSIDNKGRRVYTGFTDVVKVQTKDGPFWHCLLTPKQYTEWIKTKEAPELATSDARCYKLSASKTYRIPVHTFGRTRCSSTKAIIESELDEGLKNVNE